MSNEPIFKTEPGALTVNGVTIGMPPKGRTYTLEGIGFDVWKAYGIILENPRLPLWLEVPFFAPKLVHHWVDIGTGDHHFNYKYNLEKLYPETDFREEGINVVDFNHALRTDSPLAGIGVHTEFGLALIDGSHRLCNAYLKGIDSFPFFCLTKEEGFEVSDHLRRLYALGIDDIMKVDSFIKSWE